MHSLFAPGFKNEPYWWDAAPPPAPKDLALPAKVDVAIIGGGYTGLSAAIQTARAGRSTLVIEAERAGWGCSSRNGGQVSTSIKPDYATLSQRHGHERAVAIRREGKNALAFIEDFIRTENIDCDWRVVGRYHAAHNLKEYAALESALGKQLPEIAVPYEMVPKDRQHEELGSDRYYGGVIYPKHASLQPARYAKGLAERAEAAGATILAGTKALSIDRDGEGFIVTTSKGKVKARDVLVASNGYTGPGTPWHRRRVIPIGSYIIATEELDPAIAAATIPKDRVVSDTRKVVLYWRLSPDKKRVVFGGRVAAAETDTGVTAPRLHQVMCDIHPQLKGSKISHSWVGFVAYTFDTMPHIGRQDGVWYSMGYCGSGVSLASYFGMRIGQQIVGKKEGGTALDGLAFPTRPLYSGKPWFLPMAVRYYRLRDKLPF